MNTDKFERLTMPFERTLFFRLPAGTAPDARIMSVLGAWNSPLVYAETSRGGISYDVTGRVPLRGMLGKTMTRVDALHLFQAVADAMLYAAENGIDQRFIVLDSDLAFVSEQNGSVRFLCVPAVGSGLTIKPLRQYIKELIVNLTYDGRESLDYVGRVINFLNQYKTLDPEHFIEFLDKLEQESAKDESNTLNALASQAPAPAPVKEVPPAPAPAEQPVQAAGYAQPVMPQAEIPAAPAPVVPEIRPETPFISAGMPYLIRKKGGEKIAIDKDEFKIGKIPGMADFVLADNPAVSRMHAVIRKIEGSYYICDNYSTNGTFLNGEQLEPGKNYILLNGVQINFGNETFAYYMD